MNDTINAHTYINEKEKKSYEQSISNTKVYLHSFSITITQEVKQSTSESAQTNLCNKAIDLSI